MYKFPTRLRPVFFTRPHFGLILSSDDTGTLSLIHSIKSPSTIPSRYTTALIAKYNSPKGGANINWNITMSSKKETSNEPSGIEGAAKTVTSTVGGTAGGLLNTVGGVVGGASRGVGETVNALTGGIGQPLGDAISNVGTGVEGGVASVAKGAKDAGEWKKTGGS
jgi:hypothetical protein